MALRTTHNLLRILSTAAAGTASDISCLLQHGEAIKALSDALKLATEPQEKAHIMLTRSQAFTGSVVVLW